MFNSSSTNSPKQNHEAMVQLQKQLIEIFQKESGTRYEIFQLSTTENMTNWANIAKTVSANQDEEVWLEQVSYKNLKERDEYMTKWGNDEAMN